MIWLVTWSSTALLGVDLGLAVGVVFAIMTVIVRTQKPYCSLMGKIPGTDIYRDVAYYKDVRQTNCFHFFFTSKGNHECLNGQFVFQLVPKIVIVSYIKIPTK